MPLRTDLCDSTGKLSPFHSSLTQNGHKMSCNQLYSPGTSFRVRASSPDCSWMNNSPLELSDADDFRQSPFALGGPGFRLFGFGRNFGTCGRTAVTGMDKKVGRVARSTDHRDCRHLRSGPAGRRSDSWMNRSTGGPRSSSSGER